MSSVYNVSKILIDIENKIIGINLKGQREWPAYKYGLDDDLPKDVQNFIEKFTRTISLRS